MLSTPDEKITQLLGASSSSSFLTVVENLHLEQNLNVPQLETISH